LPIGVKLADGYAIVIVPPARPILEIGRRDRAVRAVDLKHLLSWRRGAEFFADEA
jgi:hypothetical protein